MAKACAKRLAIAMGLALCTQASAAPPKDTIVPLTADCIAAVSQAYEIHHDVLFAILLVEGGTVGKNSRANDNGSYDIGPFQINTIHLDAIANLGVSEAELRNNGCVNAEVAAWHLNRVLTPQVLANVTDDESYLRAIALYHSATPTFNKIYASKLRREFERLYAGNAQ